jgi:thymidylate synthase
LLWILRGSTDVQELADLGVRVWNGNTSREALDRNGFTDRPEYDLGPTYGFNVRHFGFGEQYTDKYADYSGRGKD